MSGVGDWMKHFPHQASSARGNSKSFLADISTDFQKRERAKMLKWYKTFFTSNILASHLGQVQEYDPAEILD